MFMLTTPQAAVADWGFGKERMLPCLHILPQLSAQQGQHVPFYGLLNPSLPMFALSDLTGPHLPGRTRWWRVRSEGRYGGNAPSLVEFDPEGRVRQFQVFVGEPRADRGNLLERWIFSRWQRCAAAQFPGKIQGDWFAIPRFGVGHTRRTARREHVELSLVHLKLSPPSDRIFSIWRLPHLGMVYDDRYRPARTYLYGALHGGSGVERQGSSDRVARLPTLLFLLAAAAVLQIIRVRLRRPISRSAA
jgi:hypothetical protein